jgi:hypothetical protein
MAVALVQSNAVITASNLASQTAAFTSTTTTGNLLVAIIFTNVKTVSALTDNKGNTWTLQNSFVNFTGSWSLYVYYCANATGGASHTLTATESGTGWNFYGGLHEFSGATTTSPIESLTSNTAITSNANATLPTNGAAITTTTINDYVMGIFDATTSTTFTAATGWALLSTARTGVDLATVGAAQTATGTYTPQIKSAITSWSEIAWSMAIKAAISGTVITKTQTATARIAQKYTKTQSSTAHITAVVNKTQTATAKIASTLAKTQTATARIAQNFTKTQPATAKIAVTVTKTQTAIAKIAKNLTKTQTAIARIRGPKEYYRDSVGTLPTTNSTLATAYTATDITNVATVDGVFVDLAGFNTYLIHEFVVFNASQQIITPTWTGKSTKSTVTFPVYLQIYNFTTPGWTTLTSNNTTAAGTVFTLTASQSTSLSSFYDANGYCWVRVYQ